MGGFPSGSLVRGFFNSQSHQCIDRGRGGTRRTSVCGYGVLRRDLAGTGTQQLSGGTLSNSLDFG